MNEKKPDGYSPVWDANKSWRQSLIKDNVSKTSQLLVPGNFKPEVYNRLSAIFKTFRHCPDYFVLFEPLIRERATEEEIMQAKKALIKERYPKFYKEVFEDAAEVEEESL